MVTEDELNKEAGFKGEVAPLLMSYVKDRLKKEAEESSESKLDDVSEKRLLGLFQIALDQAFDRLARGVAASTSSRNSQTVGRKLSDVSRSNRVGKLLVRGAGRALLEAAPAAQKSKSKAGRLSLAA